MKHLIISEISLLSNRDRKARRITFDPRRTIILGLNQTGKSSLVKSIYYALGAEPAKVDQRWINAEVKSLIKFTVDGEGYMLTRDGNYFSAFTIDGKFIANFGSITDGVGPFLARIFDFKLALPSREQDAQTPPPAFLYLPFYVDQDSSWQSPWSAFARLFQFTNWKSSVAEYHTGVRDNFYYELLANWIDLQKAVVEKQQRVEGLRKVMRKLSEDSTKATFDLNPQDFGEQIEKLLTESNTLMGEEAKLKEKLSDLSSQRALQQARLKIATRALGELGKDLDFLANLPSDHIECPTCGTEYENDFAARFAIARDEDRVAIFIDQIRSELLKIERAMNTVYEDYRLTSVQVERIRSILSEKQGELTLQQVIESEGRKAADNLLQGQLRELDLERAEAVNQKENAHENLKAHEEKLESEEKAVLEEYVTLLRKNLAGLDVKPLSIDTYSRLAPAIRETGSSLPRALLAYYFTIFELASKRTPATVCPFVVDSPNQQAQDDASLEVMLKFIASEQPENTQMILAIEKTMGVDLGGKLIELTEKYNLLREDEYEGVRGEFTNLTRNSVR